MSKTFANGFLLAVLAAAAPACDRAGAPGTGAPARSPGPRAGTPRTGVAEFEPGPDFRPTAGQTIYVPAYSHVHTSSDARPFDLAVTLSVRNTDRDRPIVLTAVRYHDQDGKLVRDPLPRPLRIAPLAAMEFFVEERDTSGGSSASFLVEWVAVDPVSPPVVEAVMIGTASTQGISFTCPGRVVSERTPAGPGSTPR